MLSAATSTLLRTRPRPFSSVSPSSAAAAYSSSSGRLRRIFSQHLNLNLKLNQQQVRYHRIGCVEPTHSGDRGFFLSRCFTSASAMSSHSPQRAVASTVGQAKQPLSQVHIGKGTGTATDAAPATDSRRSPAAPASKRKTKAPSDSTPQSSADQEAFQKRSLGKAVGNSQSFDVPNPDVRNDKTKDQPQRGRKQKKQKKQKGEVKVGAQKQQQQQQQNSKQRKKKADRKAKTNERRTKGSQHFNPGQQRKRKARPSSSSSSSSRSSSMTSSSSSEESLPPPVRRLVVGLGNPGQKYTLTRHNVGFTIVEALFDLLRPSATGGSSGFSFNNVLHADEAGLQLAFEASSCTEATGHASSSSSSSSSATTTESNGVSTRGAFSRPLPQIDLVDQLSARRRRRTRDEGVPFPALDVHILKPQTFMNLSGQSVVFARSGAGSRGTIKEGPNRKADTFLGFPRKRYHFRSDPLDTVDRGDELVVITDDFDLPFGHLRFRHKNVASHNGLKNITDVLGTNIYVNLRVGIGLPAPANHPGNPNSVGKLNRGPKAYASYVLEDFTAQEQAVLPDLQRFAVDVLRVYFHRGLAAAQQVAHGQVVSDYASNRDSLAAAAEEAAAAEMADNADAAAATKRMALSAPHDAVGQTHDDTTSAKTN